MNYNRKQPKMKPINQSKHHCVSRQIQKRFGINSKKSPDEGFLRCSKHKKCCFNLKLFEDLKETNPNNICLKLGSCEKCFKNFLDEPVDIYTTTLFLKVLKQSFDSFSLKEMNNKHLSIMMYSRFFDHINDVIIAITEINDKERDFLIEFFDVLKIILTVTPSNYVKVMQTVGLIDIAIKGSSDSEIESKIKELSNLSKPISSEHATKSRQKKHSLANILGDFRDLNLTPTLDETVSPKKPVIQKNLKEGVYENLEHYLDVQFRLLREDFVAPLREGLASCMECKNILKESPNDAFYVYHDVYVCDWETSNNGVQFKVSFDVSKFFNINWEQNKRFIFGSLVCLSEDKFLTTHYATISDRISKELQKGIVTLNFFSDVKMDSILNKKFVMVESKAFFEGYRHVLTGLKEIVSSDLPFQDYILYADKNVKVPKYLTQTNPVFDLSCLTDKCKLVYNYTTRTVKVESPSLSAIKVNVLANKWPEAMSLNFNDSQLNAFSNILSKEFSLTQGPPGTGKTYIGLQVVKALCSNHEKWCGRPMLIVCYTNHSLDQFLEGIDKFLVGGIVRVGGRSSSEVLKKYNLRDLKSDMLWKKDKDVERNRYTVKDEMKELKHEIDLLTIQFQTRKRNILSIDVLQPYMGHFYNMLIESFGDNINDHFFEIWLGMKDIPVTEYYTEETVNYNETNQSMRDVDFLQEDRMLDRDINDLHQARFKRKFVFGGEINEGVNLVDEDGFQRPAKEMKKLRAQLKRELNAEEIMSVEKINLISNSDLWIMPVSKRWCLYRYWLSLYSSKLLEDLFDLATKFNVAAKRLEELRYEEDKTILGNSLIIGMTTTGAARYRAILQELQPRIIIVEEAAEILEAHIITSLNRSCEQLILIGDHKQLQPSTNVYKLAKYYNLDVSLFERMFNNNIEVKCLTDQHRMRPEIAELVHPIYPGLQNHESVTQYENIRGIHQNLYFINHSHAENEVTFTKSKINPYEASFIIQLCCYLRKQDYESSQITILTTYLGQLFYIKKLVKEQRLCEDVRVSVVDNYQGEENDIILLSLVRSNDRDSIGYLKIDNRVCVALSRAKKGLYVIGNFQLLARNSPLWAGILLSLEEKRLLVDAMMLKCENHPGTFAEVASLEDFSRVPEGGCLKPCNTRLDCGHTCTLMCHPYDKEHKNTMCLKKCVRVVPDCNHLCLKSCSEKCKPCQTKVSKEVPNCFHIQEMLCSENPIFFICKEPCPRELACGHKCLNTCGESCLENCPQIIVNKCPLGHTSNTECYKKDKCFVTCNKILDCEHTCKGYCSQCNNTHIHKPCDEGCTRILICGHKCQTKDCSSCLPCEMRCENKCVHNECKKKCGEPCEVCVEPCNWQCAHYSCSKLCYEPCDRPACKEPCNKLLKCGHQCVGLCGEQCPNLCSICHGAQLKEIFFGNEDEDGTRFVQLQDCKHVFEVNGLDHWMTIDVVNSEIQLKCCPKCKIPIRRNQRYGNLINKTLDDIEEVKQKLNADPRKVSEFFKTFIKSKPFLKKLLDIKIRSEEDLISMKSKVQFLEVLSKLKISSDYLVTWLTNHKKRFTPQELKDLKYEVLRLQTLQIVEDTQNELKQLPDILHVLKKAYVYLEGFYSEEKNSNIKTILDEVKTLKPGLNISQKEKIEILDALQLRKGQWFKCKNGHVYAIGDCGGAMEKSVCPDCKCEIGGTSHQLVASNTLAPEMDGASHAAWSNAANLDLG